MPGLRFAERRRRIYSARIRLSSGLKGFAISLTFSRLKRRPRKMLTYYS